MSIPLVVLVNGLPGAGKTTLAPALAAALDLPVMCKDAVKETIADVLGAASAGSGPASSDVAQRQWSQLLGAAAMESIWTLLAGCMRGAVIEANLLASTRPFVRAGLLRAGIDPTTLVEVWCDVPAYLARQRFEQRAPHRHAIHGVQVGLHAQWARWTVEAEPVGFGRVIRIDATTPVDVAGLVATIRRSHGSLRDLEEDWLAG